MANSRILVLGVGNLLLRDEGVGVHAVRALEAQCALPDHVRVVDGGTAGPALLGEILDCDRLIVVDAARLDAPPGTITRLGAASLPRVFKAKQSAHDWGLCEVILQAQLLGHHPAITLIAVEPEDMEHWSTDLSPTLATRLPSVVAALRTEIAYSDRSQSTP
jgi:hydrogenase maturation protease